MSKKKIIVDFPIYKIIADGGLSSDVVGEGRFIPSLIIDADDLQVKEVIEMHQDIEDSGDAIHQWSLPKTFFTPKHVMLIVDFLKPMKVKFGIEFDIKKQYALIDGIVNTRAFYLQVGKEGDKVSDFSRNFILLEVPDMNFDAQWNSLLNKTLVEINRKKGASKKEAKKIVLEQIKSMKEIYNLRR